MPYAGNFNRSINLARLMVEEDIILGRHSTPTNKDWTPKASQVRGNERIRFQNHSDNLSGGLQYWCKQKNKALKNTAKAGDSNATMKKVLGKASEKARCNFCGGFASEEGRYLRYSNRLRSVNKCAFQKEYCDVLGPCAECSLLRQRTAIVQKQTVEFPGIEVTPRRLVAPSLADIMLGDKADDNSYTEPGRSVLELPSISPNTLRYMRREAGSTKQKRKACFPHQEPDTHKKYIEIRLPKI